MAAVEFQLPHLTIRGFAYGDDKLPTLLCLHGWLDNAASFSKIQPYLSHYHVVMIDFPGHGLSDHKSSDAYYHFVDWLDDLYCLFQHNNWQNIHLLGHSMGAMIASAFSAAFPEKVKSLVLIDALGFITVKPENTAEQLKKGIVSRHKVKHKKINVYESRSDAIAARVKHSDLSEELAAIIVNRSLRPYQQGYTWRYDAKLTMVSPYRFSPEQAENILRNLSVPCLFIARREVSDIVNLDIKKALAVIDNISCHYLDGGHHLHLEQPSKIASLICCFHQNLIKNH